MAVGFSGSNGGITSNHKKLSSLCLQSYEFCKDDKTPLEISYFINNTCNLKCRHCYVGYSKTNDSLTLQEWTGAFDELVSLGAKTFGNVGKEPLLNWEKTKPLLEYLKHKKEKYTDMRFGFVTNGILLNDMMIVELDKIMPDYIDISLDGNKEVHDFIRGEGAYDALMTNLQNLSQYKLSEKVFISFTLNRMNASCVDKVIQSIYDMGFKNLLISPYVTLDANDMLYISDDKIIAIIQGLIKGESVDFSEYEGLNIYIKTDFTTTRPLMEKMADIKIINKDELLIDDYGVIFNKYELGKNIIYFNYMPFDTSLKTAIRISHDGYVSNCLDMFYENYPERAIGNIQEKGIKEILENVKIHSATLAA